MCFILQVINYIHCGGGVWLKIVVNTCATWQPYQEWFISWLLASSIAHVLLLINLTSVSTNCHNYEDMTSDAGNSCSKWVKQISVRQNVNNVINITLSAIKINPTYITVILSTFFCFLICLCIFKIPRLLTSTPKTLS